MHSCVGGIPLLRTDFVSNPAISEEANVETNQFLLGGMRHDIIPIGTLVPF